MDGGAIRNWSSSGLVRQPAAMLSGSNSIVIIRRLLKPSTSRLGKGGGGGGVVTKTWYTIRGDSHTDRLFIRGQSSFKYHHTSPRKHFVALVDISFYAAKQSLYG